MPNLDEMVKEACERIENMSTRDWILACQKYGGYTPTLKAKLVVRLTTSYWKSNRGVHVRKDVMFLKRQSQGLNILEEDCGCVGAEEVIPRIINLYDQEDGVYQVVICNEQEDWETGCVEQYDYKLVALPEEKA